jgi:hypothetical protein
MHGGVAGVSGQPLPLCRSNDVTAELILARGNFTGFLTHQQGWSSRSEFLSFLEPSSPSQGTTRISWRAFELTEVPLSGTG